MMKKFTLFLMLLVSTSWVNSQVVDTFFMNYGIYENVYANNQAGLNAYNLLGLYELNSNFTLANGNSRIAMNWLMKDYSRVGFALADGTFFEYPNSGFQLDLDTLSFTFYHNKTAPGFDTLKVTVLDLNSIPRDANGIPTSSAGTELWSQTFPTDTALLGAGDFASRTDLVLTPGIQLAPDQKFSVLLEYVGDTANSVVPAWVFSNECTQADGAQLAQVAFNSNYLVQYGPVPGISGVWPDGIAYPSPPNCNLVELQNWNLTAIVRLTNLSPGVVLTDDQLTGSNLKVCLGDEVQLTANVTGIAPGSEDDYDFSWSPSTAVSDSNILNPTFIVDSNNTEVIFTLTDTVNNVSFSDTVQLLSAIITSVTVSDNNVLLACSDTSNVTVTATSPISSIRDILWSNGDSAILQTADEGNYTVVVTNLAGCSSSSSVSVAVQGANDVNFSVPGSLCTGEIVEIPNGSERTAGWGFTWHITQGTDTISSPGGENFIFQFTDPGTYELTLVGDSSSCVFTRTRTITVNDGEQPPCVSSISDVNFNNLAVYPNPSNAVLNVVFDLDKNQDVDIAAYTVTGKQVHTQSFTATSSVNTAINTSNFVEGVYILKIQTEQGVKTQRFVVEHN